MEEKNQNKQQIYMNSYRVFFPFSLIGGMYAAFIWAIAWMKSSGWLSQEFIHPYPVNLHIHSISGIFILPALKGFIFTAIPRFTGTEFLTGKKISVFLGIQIIMLLYLFIFTADELFIILQAIDFIFLSLFLYSRFKTSRVPLSSYLYLILFGTILGGFGSLLELLNILYPGNPVFNHSGKEFLYYNMIPFIIFGAGVRLFNMIINLENPPQRMKWMQSAEEVKVKQPAILLIASNLGEFLPQEGLFNYIIILMRFIRISVIVYWTVQFFHLRNFSAFNTVTGKMIYISFILFLSGLAGHLFGGYYSVHLAHLYFIGGIAIIILVIMTRITISHGGKSLELEKNSISLKFIFLLLVMAALTRGTAIFIPLEYTSHLAYSAILFVLALLIWIFRFGKYIIIK